MPRLGLTLSLESSTFHAPKDTDADARPHAAAERGRLRRRGGAVVVAEPRPGSRARTDDEQAAVAALPVSTSFIHARRA
ncbi:MAG: hypothetical protein K0V04_46640 [Deltaproteobacteria bacterium]|nr:hypothetical protein [Deltaproteobacteria bacterium]